MIPKIIHYCWFGGNPLTDDVKNYINTWKKFLPDYEIKEWNESNFDITENSFAAEAYKNKKWAFVADYARLKILEEYGGIYLDTDVEVLKSMDPLLKYQGFCGFQDDESLCTAVLACEPHFDLFKYWLDFYSSKQYGLMGDEEPNVSEFTQLCQKYGLKLDNQRQTVKDLEVFPTEYFSPKDFKTGILKVTPNTYTIHHFNASWFNSREKELYRREAIFIRKFGKKNGHRLSFIVNLPLRLTNAISKRGIWGETKFFFAKLKKK